MKLAIAGCMGRMGQTLIKAALEDDRFALVAASERQGFDRDAAQAQLNALGCANLPLTSDPFALVKNADAVIDFTTPESTLALAEAVAAKGGVYIIGTTGFSQDQLDAIRGFGSHARIVQSGNFSPGINLMEQLVETAAKTLDEEYDIEISEMHHKHKKDAPSGTALMLGRAAARGRSIDLDRHKALERGGERKQGDIGFAALRGGDVVGEHSVIFAGHGELLEIRHQGFSREIYANGALKSALWAKDQPPGFYTMHDVLG